MIIISRNEPHGAAGTNSNKKSQDEPEDGDFRSWERKAVFRKS